MKRIWAILAATVVIFFISVLFFLLSVRLGFFGALPGTEELRRLESYTAARVLDSKGELLGFYYVQNRTQVRISELPASLIDALIATEDARFFKHHGFDTRAYLRAIIKSVIPGKHAFGGGSTITQQLAKNLFHRKDFGILTLPVAKARELIIAIRLEKVYSKNELLELYLNTVSFGENTFGIGTASLTFFSKEPRDLLTEESALLIGLLKASSAYNPRTNAGAAHERRDLVLKQMFKYGYLDKGQLDSLVGLPVNLKYMKYDHVSGIATYFREYIRKELTRIIEDVSKRTGISYNLYTDGLTIQTTLNAGLQRHAESAVREHLSNLQLDLDENWAGREPWRRNNSLASLQISQSPAYQALLERGLTADQAMDSMKIQHPSRIFTWQGVRDTLLSPLDSILYHFGLLQCGLVAIDPASGAILAWVGGDDYEFFKYDHVTSHRQCGSTFKPLVYAGALEQGINPCKLYSAEAETYDEFDGWTPRNYDDNYDGFYSLQGALVHSVNTVSVKVLMDTGTGNVINLAKKLGINPELPQTPSLALGSADIPLLEMTAAYAAFLRKGFPLAPFAIEKITDRDGNVIYQAEPPTDLEPAMSASTAETMTGMLEAVVERGTASSLRTVWNLKNPLAGKTGTTQDQSDGWFIGMTPGIVIGVWIGGDNPIVRFRNGTLGTGASAALPVFARVIRKMNRDETLTSYVRGDFGITDETVNMLSCQDFTEKRRLRLNAKPQKVSEITKTAPDHKQKKESRHKKFLRRD